MDSAGDRSGKPSNGRRSGPPPGGSRSGGSRSGGPRSGGPRDRKPGSGAPRDSRDSRDSRGGSGRSGDRSRRSDESARPARPRGPEIPEDVDIEELDPAVMNELRTLPEELREKVAGHLAAAEMLLLDDDEQSAREHARAAKRLAGRVAAVREAAAITAYRCGDYADALGELRAVRRMTGDDSFVPMMADCERGLGRPQKALELLKEIRDAATSDAGLKIESAIVAAGARSDLGQHDAALVLLDIPELTSLPAGSERARLQYAYAAALQALDRAEQAREWFQRAAESDLDEVTDARERVEKVRNEGL
jgi:hypothetical protein